MRDTENLPFLRFPFDEIAALVDHARNAKETDATSDVVLVGDQGVYFMSTGRPLPQENGKTKVVYALGCNPDIDEATWYDIKVSTFGGDDGADYMSIGPIIDNARDLVPKPEYLFVFFSPEELIVEVLPTRN